MPSKYEHQLLTSKSRILKFSLYPQMPVPGGTCTPMYPQTKMCVGMLYGIDYNRTECTPCEFKISQNIYVGPACCWCKLLMSHYVVVIKKYLRHPCLLLLFEILSVLGGPDRPLIQILLMIMRSEVFFGIFRPVSVYQSSYTCCKELFEPTAINS